MSYSNGSAAFKKIAGSVLGSGTQTLVVDLGEDAFNGDVQFTISVNGVMVGGVQTVTAIQADKASEQFTIHGNWTGNPTVSVNFLNDDWNGSTGNGNDRNLYINAVTYNGTLVSDVIRPVLWNGPTFLGTRPVMRAAEFTGGIGVTTHLLYGDTSYRNQDMVLSALSYLGISHIRDGGSMLDPNAVLPFEAAAAAGISINFTASTDGGVANNIARLRTLVAAHPGSVVSVEGINEVSASFRYAGLSGQDAGLVFQRELYQAIKADPLLSGIPVLNYTLLSYDPAEYARLGDVSASADYGNVHLYTYGGMAALTQTMLPRMLLGTPGAQGFVVTETGYDTMSNGKDVSAKYLLDTLFDMAAAGARMTYLYELLDDFPDAGMTSVEDHFGLFNTDGTPKPSALAIHNLLSLLSDTGAAADAFTPGTLSYAVSNLPTTGQTLLLAKSDNSFDLAVWAEPLIRASPNNSQEIASPHVPVTVTFDQDVASVSVYDPMVGTAAIATYADPKSVTLDVTDHPLVLAIQVQPTSPPVPDAGSVKISSAPDPLFDAAFYRQQVPDLPSDVDPRLHYLSVGWKQGLDPSALFSTSYYLQHNPDVAAAGVNPLLHYETYGWHEGRDPSALFSTSSYLQVYPDVARAGLNPLLHYVEYGKAEGRVALAPGQAEILATNHLVDATYIYAQRPDVAAAGLDATTWFDQVGWKQGVNPNPDFDTTFYLARNADVAAAGMNPLLHYAVYGWHEGRDPSLLFSTNSYLGTYADVAAAGVDPLEHYLTYGHAEGRMNFLTGASAAADPLVDAAFYDAQLGATLVPAGLAGQQQAAASYADTGWQRGLDPSPWFDTGYYLAHNPGVAAAHVNPLADYETRGWREGSDPSAAFSTSAYLAHNPAVAAAGVNPLVDYLSGGAAMGRVAYPV